MYGSNPHLIASPRIAWQTGGVHVWVDSRSRAGTRRYARLRPSGAKRAFAAAQAQGVTATRLRFVHDAAADQRVAHLARQLEPDERRVLALAPQRRGLHPPVRVGGEHADVGVRPGPEMTAIEPKHPGRLGG